MRLRRRHVVLGLLGVLVAGAVVAFANTLTVTSGHLGAKSTATSLTTTTAANLTPNYLVTAPATATAGTAFNVTIQARLGTTNDPGVTGAQCVTFSGPGTSPAPSNTAPKYPEPVLCPTGQSSVTFTLGAATASVTLFKAEAAVTLTATSTLRSGISGSIAVNSAGVTLAFATACPVVHPKGTTQTYTVNVSDDSFSNQFRSTTGLTVSLALTGADAATYKFVATQNQSHSVSFATGASSKSFDVNGEGAKKNATLTATPATGSGFTGASCSLVGTN